MPWVSGVRFETSVGNLRPHAGIRGKPSTSIDELTKYGVELVSHFYIAVAPPTSPRVATAECPSIKRKFDAIRPQSSTARPLVPRKTAAPAQVRSSVTQGLHRLESRRLENHLTPSSDRRMATARRMRSAWTKRPRPSPRAMKKGQTDAMAHIKCGACAKYGNRCTKTAGQARCDYCNKYKRQCTFDTNFRQSQPQPKTEKCERCLRYRRRCVRTEDKERCRACKRFGTRCSFISKRQPKEERCDVCREDNLVCITLGDAGKCDYCEKKGRVCSLAPNQRKSRLSSKRGDVKCALCVRKHVECRGGVPCVFCTAKKKECVPSRAVLANDESPSVGACASCQRNKVVCSGGRPCNNCADVSMPCRDRYGTVELVHHPLATLKPLAAATDRDASAVVTSNHAEIAKSVEGMPCDGCIRWSRGRFGRSMECNSGLPCDMCAGNMNGASTCTYTMSAVLRVVVHLEKSTHSGRKAGE